MYRRRKSPSVFWKLLVLGALGYCIFSLWNMTMYFDVREILENSILQSKPIETEVVEVVSKSGVKAYLFEDKTNPIISIRFLFRSGGYAYDYKQGTANLLSSMLLEGAGNYSSQKLKEELELRAIDLSFNVDQDDFSGSLTYVKDEAAVAQNILSLVLTKPLLSKDDLNRLKEKTLLALKRQQENPSAVLELEFAKELYGNHPYARNKLGFDESVKDITAFDLQKFMRERLAKDNLIVGISGDISPEEAKEALEKIFRELPALAEKRSLPTIKAKFDGRVKSVDREIPQPITAFSSQGIARNHPDFYALYIVNHIFGENGLTSRLSLDIRENSGLTYNIYTYLLMKDEIDLIRGGFSSTGENVGKIIGRLRKQWVDLGKKGVTKKELIDAKSYLIASYNLRYTSINEIAQMMAYMQRDNLGPDFLKMRNSYIEKVGLEDANRVAKEYFKKDNLIFVTIGGNKNGRD